MPCRLCNEDKPLMESHIFPEWIYSPLYDENHRFFVLSTNANKRRSTRPRGIYERLLCHECEQRLSRWEGYARNVFLELPLKVIEGNRAFVFSGLNYASFKLFQMSLIWRASIAGRHEIHRINLGTHSEKIRKMLCEEVPGEVYEYGSILILPALSQELMQQFVYSPERLPQKIDGHTAYRTAFGGLFWLFIVSNHSSHVPHEVFLSKNGNLPVFKVGGPAEFFMQQLASNFFSAGMLNNPK